MKTTTKILGSVLIGILLLSVTYIALLSTFTGYKEYKVNDAVCVEKSMPECRYLRIESDWEGSKRMSGTVWLSTARDSTKSGTLVFSAELEKCVRTRREGDTLVIRFSGLDAFLQEKKASGLVGVKLHYYPKRLSEVENRSLFPLFFKAFHSEIPLKLVSEEAFAVFEDSCTLTRLRVDAAKQFELKDSRIDTLDVDLDRVRDWTVERCRIQLENLFGSNKHNVIMPRDEATRMNWHPRSKEAELSVALSGTPACIEYKKEP